MKLSTPVDVKVLLRRDNGSGVVEIPLLPVTSINLARTAGGGEGTAEVTVADLEQMVANFPLFPGPVPVSASPHVEDRSGVAPGFLNAVSVRGDVLFGQVDLTPALFAEVEAGGWRGFSVEMAQNLKTATVELDGWALTGGVFTNRPATDVHFRIAASQNSVASVDAAHFVALKGRQETSMADEKVVVASLEAEVKTQTEIVKNLRGQVDTMKQETAALEARLTESNKDSGSANIALSEAKAKLSASESELEHTKKQLGTEMEQRRAAEIKLEAETTRTLKSSVIELAEKAIDRGVSAKHFEGIDEDPAAWFRKRFVSLEAMGQFVEVLPTVNESAVKSGAGASDKTATLSDESVTRMRRLGLDPKYARLSSTDDLDALKAAEKEK